MKKRIKLASFFIPVIVVSETILLTLAVISLKRDGNRFRYFKSKDYFSNDDNYELFSGSIYECDYPSLLSFRSVIDKNGHEVSTKRILGDYTLSIYSNNNKELWETVDFHIGMNIEFMSAVNDNILDHPPIVYISFDNNVILHFEEGKTALLNYIEKSFNK